MDGFLAQLLNKPLIVEEGYLQLPTAPGLGVELNEEVAKAHPYTGDKLHLEMGQEPYDPRKHRFFPGG